MSPVPLRRSWLPGAALLAASIVAAGLFGLVFGVRSLPWYAGFAAASLLLAGWGERYWSPGATRPPSSPMRSRLKVIEGGKARAAYDLSRDPATGSQRYLM